MLAGILRSTRNMWVSLPSFITILAESSSFAVRCGREGGEEVLWTFQEERHSHAAEANLFQYCDADSVSLDNHARGGLVYSPPPIIK